MKFFLDRVSKLPPSSRNMIASWTTPTDLLCHPFLNEFGIFLNYTHALRFDDKPDYSYLNYTCALRFDDKPDYSYLHKLFHDLFMQEGYQSDYVFDRSVQRGAQDDQTAGPSSKAGGAGRCKVVQEGDEYRASDRM